MNAGSFLGALIGGALGYVAGPQVGQRLLAPPPGITPATPGYLEFVQAAHPRELMWFQYGGVGVGALLGALIGAQIGK